MRFSRSLVFVCCSTLLCVPGWGRQGTTPQTNAQPTSDPQAVALVQAAITALGGATAINQNNTWEFQGQLDGPIESGARTETIDLLPPNRTILVNGVSRAAPTFVTASVFLPVLVGEILVQESQDINWVLRFESRQQMANKTVNVVEFLDSATERIAQVWVFDATSGLPVRAVFNSPAQIGLTKTLGRIVDFSDWHAAAGSVYPFNVVIHMPARVAQVVQLQSVTPGIISSSSSQPSQAAGGIR